MRLREPGAVRIPSPAEMLGPGRPVTEVTFALDWRAAGLDPVRYHLVGLLLHLAAVVAAFGFLSSLLRRAGHPRARGVALVVAGLFALHPIQAESVAYAAQRSEVLSSLLYLLALLLLDRAAAGWPGWRGALSWAGGGIAWLVGMGAKTIAISAPGAFLLDQAVVAPAAERGAGPLRRRIARALLIAAPLLALSAWSASLHFRSFEANPGGGAGFARDGRRRRSLLPDPAAGAVALPPAAGLARRADLRPVLHAQQRRWTARSWPRRPGVVALLALAGWLWLRAERARGPRPAERLAAFGILFWFVALAPTSSFVPVADLAVEHRVYLACLGPFLAAVVGADALLQRLLPRPRAAAAGAALASLALLCAGDRARRPGPGLGLGGGALGVGGRRLAGERPRLDQPRAGPERAGRPGRRRGRLRRGPGRWWRARGAPPAWPATTPRCSSSRRDAPPRRSPCWTGAWRSPPATPRSTPTGPPRWASSADPSRRSRRPAGRPGRARRPPHAQPPRPGTHREWRLAGRAGRVPGRRGARPGQPPLPGLGRDRPRRPGPPRRGLRGLPPGRGPIRLPPPPPRRRRARSRPRIAPSWPPDVHRSPPRRAPPRPRSPSPRRLPGPRRASSPG